MGMVEGSRSPHVSSADSPMTATSLPKGTSTTQEVAKGFAWTPWTLVGAVTGFTAGAMYHLSSDNTVTPATIFAGTIAGMVGAGVGAIGSVVSKAAWVGTKLADEKKAS